jgi:cell division protein FtsQ
MWCAVVAYLVVMADYVPERRSAVVVESVRIVVVDTADVRTVSREKVTRILSLNTDSPTGLPVDSIDVGAIENALAALPEVKRASVRCDLEGVLTIRVEGRAPMLRVRSDGGYRFWLSDDGYIIPDEGVFGAYVPVVTGSIPFPFGPSASGSYAAIRRADYDDYLGRFTAIEAERGRLSSELADIRGKLRAARSSGPKRFWRDDRKERFAADRLVRIAEHEAEVAKTETALRELASKKASLIEKEKKSHESYIFLTKLANFVGIVERDDFWSAQIVQINVPGDAPGSNGNPYRWREPELELVPRAGDHTVLLGRLDGDEKQKLEKLRLFYLDGLRHEGWDRFGRIDIRYKDQIVCTR